MNAPETIVDRVAAAVLYEGYVLYPYRRSLKNEQRWTFGGVYPRRYAQSQVNTRWQIHTECLLEAPAEFRPEIKVRFLHPLLRRAARVTGQDQSDLRFEYVDALEASGRRYETWQEAVEREIRIPPAPIGSLIDAPRECEFAFPATRKVEWLTDAQRRLCGALVRDQQALEGTVRLEVEPAGDGVYRLAVEIANTTPLEQLPREANAAALVSLASTHTILHAPAGHFVSLIDPPEALAVAARACRNDGAWPVLVGQPGERHTMLAAPIILYDYPEVAPESRGDLFDATEIDEILNLRIMTLTDDEKNQMAALEAQTRALLERNQALRPAEMSALHGAWRGRTTGE